jgi:hypothetical protein
MDDVRIAIAFAAEPTLDAMLRSHVLGALSIVSLLAACKASDIHCGEGTHLEGNTCVVDLVTTSDGGSPDAGGTCTASVSTDVNNCGACGHVCPHLPGTEARCAMGACAYQCEVGYTDCNHDLGARSSDGCEADLSTDPLHCGRCSDSCTGTRANASPACQDSRCSFACNAGFLDCNADLPSASGNGCEVDGRSDMSNCGECGNTCTMSCSSGMCAGEQPICEPFKATITGDAGQIAIGTDGQGFLVAFIDADGVSIAALSGTGQVVAGPTLIDQVPLYGRVAVGFDGTSYVVAWAGATFTSARRYAPGTLNPAGDAVDIEPSGMADILWVLSGTGDVMLAWQRGGTLKLAAWTTGSSAIATPQTFVPTLPLPMWGRFTIARDAGGFVVAYATQDGPDAGFDNQGVAVAQLDRTGAPMGGAQVVAHNKSSADIIALATIGASAVLFETDSSSSFDVGEVDGMSPSLTHVMMAAMYTFAGGPNNGWTVLRGGGPTSISALAIGSNGAPSGQPLPLVTVPSLDAPVIASASMGTLFIWTRTPTNQTAKIQEVLLDPAGNVHNPCVH